MNFQHRPNCTNFCISLNQTGAIRWFDLDRAGVVSYRVVSCHVASHRVVSRRIASCRVVSFRVASYRVVVVSCRTVAIFINWSRQTDIHAAFLLVRGRRAGHGLAKTLVRRLNNRPINKYCHSSRRRVVSHPSRRVVSCRVVSCRVASRRVVVVVRPSSRRVVSCRVAPARVASSTPFASRRAAPRRAAPSINKNTRSHSCRKKKRKNVQLFSTMTFHFSTEIFLSTLSDL